MVVSPMCPTLLERHPDGADAPLTLALVVTGDDIITQCCYCGAVKTEQGYQGGGVLKVVGRFGRYRVSHGACEPCFDVEMAKIRAMEQ
jgi:hypothetical protein